MAIGVIALGTQLAMNKKDMNAAIHSLREAVTVQDGLHYNEPADWFFRYANH